MSVAVFWTTGPRFVSVKKIREAALASLKYGARGELTLNVILVGEKELCELHARFLGNPTPTDVLSFDLGESRAGPAGELYVSVDMAREEAARRGLDPARELALYVVHGALHLCGYNDREPGERRRMRSAERAVLRSLGFTASNPLARARARARRARASAKKVRARS